MSIGETMIATIPVVGASGTQYATDTNTFLTEVRDVLESKVPFSELQGDELDMQNVPITDAEYVGLYEQLSVPGASPVGRLERYNSNLYWVSLAGAVQITAAGTLNAAGIAGIGGDYGSPNPASFRFTDATSLYSAYDDFNTLTWAYVRARGFDIAAGATSTSFGRLRFGGVASLDFTLPAFLPVSLNSVLVINSSGQIAFNDPATAVTNDIILGGTAKIQHGIRTVKLPRVPPSQTTGSVALSGGTELVLASGAFVGWTELPVIEGWTLGSVSYSLSKATGGTATLTVRKQTAGSSSNVAAPVTTSAAGTVTLSVAGMSEVIVAGTSYYVKLELPAANDTIYEAKFTYSQAA